MLRLIALMLRVGILNTILFLVATLGIMSFVVVIASSIHDPHTLTISNIADSFKETTPFETLTEKQLQEGTMVEGKIFFNMGEFTDNYDNDAKEHYSHFAILLDDKAMSIAVYNGDDILSLDDQAINYNLALAQNNLSVWQWQVFNNEKKSKKTLEQIIQENMKQDSGITFKGKVVKMDTATEDTLRNYIIPQRGTEPSFEVIPYEIKCIRPIDWGGYILVALAGIVSIAALYIFILRMRKHKFFP